MTLIRPSRNKLQGGSSPSLECKWSEAQPGQSVIAPCQRDPSECTAGSPEGSGLNLFAQLVRKQPMGLQIVPWHVLLADRQVARAVLKTRFEPCQRCTKQMRNCSALFPVLTAKHPGIAADLNERVKGNASIPVPCHCTERRHVVLAGDEEQQAPTCRTCPCPG